jgi:GTP-binding protein
MPDLPIVAIVGRPNVGKSSLMNRIAGRRIAIVDPMSGVTRDCVSNPMEYRGVSFDLWDTGGIGQLEGQALAEEIQHQIDIAIRRAAVVVFLVDARDGMTPLDVQIARDLRKLEKPVILAANKVEGHRQEMDLGDWYKLGLGQALPVSAKEGFGTHDVLDAVLDALGEDAPTGEVEEAALKIAIVGRRNAGKSTLLNAIAEEERVIVSELPGTTRDAVDVRFEKDGKVLIAIDTAGVMRRPKAAESVDFYSHVRTEAAIRRADVVLLVLDVTVDVGRIERRLADQIVRHFKPCVIVANKWDLARERISTGDFTAYLEETMRGMLFAPIAYTTARDARNVQSVLDTAQSLFKQSTVRVGTSELNKTLEEALALRSPPPKKGKIGRILYATQARVRPPTMVLFVNDRKLFPSSYLRYLENRLRERLPFPEVPVRIVLRGRGEEEAARQAGRPRAREPGIMGGPPKGKPSRRPGGTRPRTEGSERS